MNLKQQDPNTLETEVYSTVLYTVHVIIIINVLTCLEYNIWMVGLLAERLHYQ